jgi:DNA topoisomerase-1
VGANVNALVRPVPDAADANVVAAGLAVEGESSSAFETPNPTPPATRATATTAAAAARPRDRRGGAWSAGDNEGGGTGGTNGYTKVGGCSAGSGVDHDGGCVALVVKSLSACVISIAATSQCRRSSRWRAKTGIKASHRGRTDSQRGQRLPPKGGGNRTHMVDKASGNFGESAALTFVHDTMPGFTRRRAGRGFCYYDTSGRRIADTRVVTRLRKLAIPPAWTDVWICPDQSGHIQAVGWDARGRKQYRYHAQWRAERDEEKFDRLGAFGKNLPTIREVVDEELAAREVSRSRVLAGVIALLDRTLMRVGNERYANENSSFGLTTLRNRHVSVTNQKLAFSYRGKSGVRHRSVIADRRLATLVRRCQELPGQTLFQWIDDDGDVHPIGSADVNRYLRDITGGPFTAKDFRTWGASSCVAGQLAEAPLPESQRATDRRSTMPSTARQPSSATPGACAATAMCTRRS